MILGITIAFSEVHRSGFRVLGFGRYWGLQFLSLRFTEKVWQRFIEGIVRVYRGCSL